MKQLNYSPYLKNLLRITQRNDWLEQPELALMALDQILEKVAFDEAVDYSDWKGVGQYLADQKRHFSLALAIVDLEELLPVQELGLKQSRFAELTLDLAVRAAWQQPAIKAMCKALPEPGESIPGMFVLGLGKLGGEDLNYSSDIDLIAFFDKELLPLQPMQGGSDVCSRVLKSVTQLLSGSNGGELIWRLDWRLRPEASATQIAMSVDAALDYYYFRSMPWHRLALMKARVVAGDRDLGADFMHQLDPFIWRQNLDFRAIEEIAELKERIDLEHPKLVLRGKRDIRINDEVRGFNLKLGSGGIREIEFIVNGLQLIWGGKRTNLRVTNTLKALKRLGQESLIEPDKVTYLGQDYCRLRCLENRLQMLNNEQTHNIPLAEMPFEAFMALNQLRDVEAFQQELRKLRTEVHQVFDQFFRPSQEADEQDCLSQQDMDAFSEQSQNVLRDWKRGFLRYGVSNTQSSSLRPLGASLIREVLDSSVPVEEAVAQLDQFFRRLPPGGQYLSLLQSSPQLLRGLVLPLLYSPAMRILLQQSPHIIDGLLTTEAGGNNSDCAFEPDWIFQNRDYDVRLERIRRQVNEELYKLYLALLEELIDPIQLQSKLSDLAVLSLETAIRIVQEETGDAPELCIFGLGKLGMSRMAPMSDLDIIYIYSDRMVTEEATGFVNRLQTALSTRMKEGVVYEMDTRLRPSGQSGAPTISMTSFSTYQIERAKSWEHIALVAGRSVIGHAETQELIDSVRLQVLAKPRNREQFVMDAGKMLLRIRDQRIKGSAADIINTKLRPGGLMETEYLIACLAIKLAPQHTDILPLKFLHMVDRIGELADMPELASDLKFWSVLQIWERLLGLENRSVAEIPKAFQPIILRQLELQSIEEIALQSSRISERILTALDNELQLKDFNADAYESWQEAPVHWQE